MSQYALVLSDAEVDRYRMMASSARASEADLWSVAGIREGAVVADVGCGPGAVSALVAEVVGPSGRVWAVDQDPQAVARAEAMAAMAGVANVHTKVGPATATGLEPASVDVAMMRHVLAHNGGREQEIVDHLASLVRPGGSVYLVDIEASAMRARPEIPDLIDLSDRYHAFQTERGNDLAVGLRLADLLSEAGLDVVVHRGYYDIVRPGAGFRPPSWAARDLMIEAGAATPADVERWAAALDRLDQQDVAITIFVPLFCAIGRRR